MTPEQFIKSYESALASQDWKHVDPLISETACVTFSTGKINKGKKEIQTAYEINFAKIKSEKYSMENIYWLKKEANFAAYIFEYNWSGIINDNLISGSGIGTSVIIKEDDEWKLLSEHLGKHQST